MRTEPSRALRRATRAAVATLACSAAQSAVAESQSSYVLGSALVAAPEYSGAEQNALKLRPLLAYQYGRFRFATSRAGALLGADGYSAGATADLVSADRFRFGAGLRIDPGRKASDSDDLAGLPEIRRTLRGRLYGSWAFDRNWTLISVLSQDLLGRAGGATASLDLGFGDRLTARSTWSAGGGFSFANERHMRTYYGVDAAASRRSSFAAYEPDGGAKDVHFGVGARSVLAPQWTGFAGVGVTRLLGDAAASPLAKSATSLSANVGVAYRCCK